jgi:hypothetical protein
LAYSVSSRLWHPFVRAGRRLLFPILKKVVILRQAQHRRHLVMMFLHRSPSSMLFFIYPSSFRSNSRDAAAAQALSTNLMFSTEVWICGSYPFFRDNLKFISMNVRLVCFTPVNRCSLCFFGLTQQVKLSTASHSDCFHQAHPPFFFPRWELIMSSSSSTDQDVYDIIFAEVCCLNFHFLINCNHVY